MKRINFIKSSFFRLLGLSILPSMVFGKNTKQIKEISPMSDEEIYTSFEHDRKMAEAEVQKIMELPHYDMRLPSIRSSAHGYVTTSGLEINKIILISKDSFEEIKKKYYNQSSADINVLYKNGALIVSNDNRIKQLYY